MNSNPLNQFKKWMDEAQSIPSKTYYNAACLATLSEDGYPDSRIILIKDIQEDALIFFTNSLSSKGEQLKNHPKASLTLFWEELGRQIRVQGNIEFATETESDTYFATRPRESQLGAWASLQSQTLESRELLESRLKEFEAKFEGKTVPRPPHWKGYRLTPHRIEFWIEGRFRLHDRFIHTKDNQGVWTTHRAYP
jgi:pyridoxamine 5'-phosphate oxidase